MLNVKTNVYKRDCLHKVEFPSKGKSDFPRVVCVPDAGGEQVCVCIFESVHSALSCHYVTCSIYNSSGVSVLVQRLLGKTLVCCTSVPANVLLRDVPFILLRIAITL